jgi:hypothetical protein
VQNDGAAATSGSSSSLASSIVVPQLSSTGKAAPSSTPSSPTNEPVDVATDVGSVSEVGRYTTSEHGSDASELGRYSDREDDWDIVTDDTGVSSGEDEL